MKVFAQRKTRLVSTSDADTLEMYPKHDERLGNHDVSIWKGPIKAEDLKYTKSSLELEFP